MVPDGLKGGGLGVFGSVRLEGNLRHLPGTGPRGGDQFRGVCPGADGACFAVSG